jgi:cholera toxin transcriptional activator
VRFGVFEADARSGELRKSGLRLRLQEQPFRVLMVLVSRAGDVVTRDELRQQLWPGDTFVDFDHGLNTAINKLRDVLADSATNPRFIETLPRRGYRFVAQVERVNGDPVVQSPVGAPVATSPAEVIQPSTPETPADELPRPSRPLTRTLFALAQLMYLVFYVVALFRLEHLHESVPDAWLIPTMVAILVTAPIGIALRLYLLTAVAFDYPKLGASFLRLFYLVFLLDLIWAIAPFLLVPLIGVGGALAACAALVYLPFSQRTLIRMAYSL